MCTPTDRALAIEELEHIQAKVKEWISKLNNASFWSEVMYVTNDMDKEISK